MLFNYLKIALRNITNNKGFSFLNLANLSIALTVCFLIFLYVRFELSFDEFHNEYENIYRIDSHSLERDIRFASTPAHLAQTLKDDFSEVESAVRIASIHGYLNYQNEILGETKFYCADPGFFEIFSYSILNGNSKYLDEPFSLFITKKMADKYFGGENPIGQTILLDNKYELVIRGVLENIPRNSYLQFDYLISMSTLKSLKGENWLTRWVSHDFQTFVKLKQNSNKNLFEEKLGKLIRPPDIDDEKNRDVFFSQPIKDIHLSSLTRGEIEQTNSIQGVSFLILIAVFILTISSLNYLTLTTARSMKRNREIGVRKVLGANKSDLIFQLIIESIIFSLCSFLFAVIMVYLFLPNYNNFMGIDLKINFFHDFSLLMIASVFMAMLVGIYPAVYLSSKKPSTSLKIGLKSRRSFSFFLPRILVVVQFIITIALISCSIVIYNQIQFMVKKSRITTQNPIIIIDVNDTNLKIKYKSLLNDFKQSSLIKESAVSFNNPSRITWGTGLHWQGEEKDELVRFEHIDYDYLKFYDLEIIEGREFLPEMGADKTTSIIINETAAKESPWQNPIGKHCTINFREYTVIGIVKDFHMKPLYEKVEPLVFHYVSDLGSWAGINYISLKIENNKISEAIKFLKETWAKHSSYTPFSYSFLDDMIDAQYSQEKIISSYFIYFTVIAILLSNLGLIGLITFTAAKRKKEIGIRKAVGAKFSDILFMMIKDTLKWIVVSVIIALPIAYYSIELWLQRFAYHININVFPFAIAIIVALAFAVLSISHISIRAALTNPVNILRSE